MGYFLQPTTAPTARESRPPVDNSSETAKTEVPEFFTVNSGRRFYSPELGRWLSRDPIGERGGVNVYGFVGNDAVKEYDTLGMLIGIQRPSSYEEGYGAFQYERNWIFHPDEIAHIDKARSIGGVMQHLIYSAKVWNCFTGNLIHERKYEFHEIWEAQFLGDWKRWQPSNRDLFSFKYPNHWCTKGEVSWKSHAWAYSGFVVGVKKLQGYPSADLLAKDGPVAPAIEGGSAHAEKDVHLEVVYRWDMCSLPWSHSVEMK